MNRPHCKYKREMKQVGALGTTTAHSEPTRALLTANPELALSHFPMSMSQCVKDRGQSLFSINEKSKVKIDAKKELHATEVVEKPSGEEILERAAKAKDLTPCEVLRKVTLPDMEIIPHPVVRCSISASRPKIKQFLPVMVGLSGACRE